MVEVKDLFVQLGSFSLKNVNLLIEKNEYFVILGPNGAGKTVLLETIAGLHRVKKGEIRIYGEDVTDLPPDKRNVGYVPQDSVLFPFLNAKENIEFPLEVKGYPKAERERRVRLLSSVLGIEHILKKNVTTLSGGERQKVAIARALASFPQLLLLDEPLSSIDVATSKLLRMELKRFHRELGITIIHVTHNLSEAQELASRICVLDSGKVEQIGTPEDLLLCPKSEKVSDLFGTVNIFEVEEVRPIGHGLLEAKSKDLKIVIPHEKDGIRMIVIPSRDVYLSTERPPGPEINRFRGRIVEIRENSLYAKMNVAIGQNLVKVEVPRQTFEELRLTVGKDVFLIFKLRKIKAYGGRV